MFKEMIKQQFPLKTSARVSDDLPPFQFQKRMHCDMLLDMYAEISRKKLKQSSSTLKEEPILIIIFCTLMMMTLKKTLKTGSTQLIEEDYGMYVSDATYMVFQSMAEVVRAHLRRSNMRGLSLPGGKDLLISKITSDEDVQFHWCIAAAAFGEEEGF